jgi:hypothetical protein
MKGTIAVLHNLQMAFHDKNTCIFAAKMDSMIFIANSNDLPKVIFRISYTPWIFRQHNEIAAVMTASLFT